MDIVVVHILADVYIFKMSEIGTYEHFLETEDVTDLLSNKYNSPTGGFYKFLLNKFENKISSHMYTKDDIKYASVTVINSNNLETICIDDVIK